MPESIDRTEMGATASQEACSSSSGWGGPRIVYATTLAMLLCAVVFRDGFSTEAARIYLRVSGRVALGLFFFSFGASAWHAMFRRPFTAALIRNRRYVGIATVVALYFHLSALAGLALTDPVWRANEAPLYVTIPGGVTYLLVGLMGLTANDASRRKLGARAWKTLHIVGGYATLGAFLFEYILVAVLVPEYKETMWWSGSAYLFAAVPLTLLIARVGQAIGRRGAARLAR